MRSNDTHMKEPIIEIKNLSKSYKISHEAGGYITLRDIISNTLKHPLKFLKKKAKKMVGKDKDEIFWALKDINFTVQPGETIGIIGANGSGKSTLLKILSQITPPTTGEARIRGKMTSLLEVGTGFHPELTGRENISLNGAIMGMSRQDIASKFDQIVEFAGVEKFLDTAVKYYSSGMYVRLAFSVAAHMEPDILVVDEVLAVGDAEFQKKCLGKMEEVTQEQGRTILFVSHNLDAVKRLCNRCVLLRKGEIIKTGPTQEIIDYYLNNEQNLNSVIEYKPRVGAEGQITKISILDRNKKPSAQLPINDGFSIQIEYEVYREMKNAVLSVMFLHEGNFILNTSSGDREAKLQTYAPGKYVSTIIVPPSLFNVGYYQMRISLQRPSVEQIDLKTNISFEVIDVDNPRGAIYNNSYTGVIGVQLDYKTDKIA